MRFVGTSFFFNMVENYTQQINKKILQAITQYFMTINIDKIIS